MRSIKKVILKEQSINENNYKVELKNTLPETKINNKNNYITKIDKTSKTSTSDRRFYKKEPTSIKTLKLNLLNNRQSLNDEDGSESSKDSRAPKISLFNESRQTTGSTKKDDRKDTTPNTSSEDVVKETRDTNASENLSPSPIKGKFNLRDLFSGRKSKEEKEEEGNSETNDINQPSQSSNQNNKNESNQRKNEGDNPATPKPKLKRGNQPKAKLKGNPEKAIEQNPNKGRTSLFRNERSTTYRRDFIRANPPFKIPFFGEYYMCNLCFKLVKIEDMQVDHIYPVSKGGSNGTGNLAPLCQPCNLDKSNKRDSRILQIYATKYGGKAIGVPISLAIRSVSATGKAGFKTVIWTVKKTGPSLMKLIVSVFTRFMKTSFRTKAAILGVSYVAYKFLI